MPNGSDTRVCLEKLDFCPNCQSKDFVEWAKAYDIQVKVSDQGFVYSRCNACGVLFQSTRPDIHSIGLFYPDHYSPYTAKPADQRETSLLSKAAFRLADYCAGARPFRRKLADFYGSLKTGSVILDFGCGAGHFLDSARIRGCETIGMDFSKTALEQVALRGHRALSITETDWDTLRDGSISFIRVNHTIEHLYDPKTILERLFRKLAPGGRLHIATPNSDSLSASNYLSFWLGLDCPRHLIIFTPKTLFSLASEYDFSSIEIIQEPAIKDIVRSHFYYEEKKRNLNRNDLEHALNNGFYALRFALLARGGTRLHRCDRIHLLAQKA